MSQVFAQPRAAADCKPKRPPKLREARLEDFAQIVSLTAPYRFATSQWTEEQWRHVWRNNPVHQRLGENFSTGWVLEADRRIVGHVGHVPLWFQFEGRQLTISYGYTFVVEREYRGYAPFLLDQYENQQGIDVVVGHQVNLDSLKSHLALGARPVPLGAWDRKAVWITDHQEFIADWLGRKNLPAAGLLSYPAALALSMKDARDRMLLRRHARGEAAIEMSAAFDERFDSFWQELCAEYPEKFLACRSRASLEWRFHFALRERRLWIATISRGGRLRAYAIFLLQKNSHPQDHLRRLIVADFQSLDRDEGIYYAMLRGALEQSRKSGIHLLVTVGISASGTDMSATAPYRNRLPQHSTSLYKSLDAQLSKALENPQVWCPTLYDADLSL